MTKNKASLLALSAFLFFLKGSSSVFSMMVAETEEERVQHSTKINEVSRDGFEGRRNAGGNWELKLKHPPTPLPQGFNYPSFRERDLIQGITARMKTKQSLSPKNPLAIPVTHVYTFPPKGQIEEFSQFPFHTLIFNRIVTPPSRTNGFSSIIAYEIEGGHGPNHPVIRIKFEVTSKEIIFSSIEEANAVVQIQVPDPFNPDRPLSLEPIATTPLILGPQRYILCPTYMSYDRDTNGLYHVAEEVRSCRPSTSWAENWGFNMPPNRAETRTLCVPPASHSPRHALLSHIPPTGIFPAKKGPPFHVLSVKNGGCFLGLAQPLELETRNGNFSLAVLSRSPFTFHPFTGLGNLPKGFYTIKRNTQGYTYERLTLGSDPKTVSSVTGHFDDIPFSTALSLKNLNEIDMLSRTPFLTDFSVEGLEETNISPKNLADVIASFPSLKALTITDCFGNQLPSNFLGLLAEQQRTGTLVQLQKIEYFRRSNFPLSCFKEVIKAVAPMNLTTFCTQFPDPDEPGKFVVRGASLGLAIGGATGAGLAAAALCFGSPVVIPTLVLTAKLSGPFVTNTLVMGAGGTFFGGVYGKAVGHTQNPNGPIWAAIDSASSLPNVRTIEFWPPFGATEKNGFSMVFYEKYASEKAATHQKTIVLREEETRKTK